MICAQVWQFCAVIGVTSQPILPNERWRRRKLRDSGKHKNQMKILEIINGWSEHTFGWLIEWQKLLIFTVTACAPVGNRSRQLSYRNPTINHVVMASNWKSQPHDWIIIQSTRWRFLVDSSFAAADRSILNAWNIEIRMEKLSEHWHKKSWDIWINFFFFCWSSSTGMSKNCPNQHWTSFVWLIWRRARRWWRVVKKSIFVIKLIGCQFGRLDYTIWMWPSQHCTTYLRLSRCSTLHFAYLTRHNGPAAQLEDGFELDRTSEHGRTAQRCD